MEERFRALRLTRGLLTRVAAEPRLRSSLRLDALSCLERYPDDADIQGWLDGTISVDTVPWGIAFIFARTLLQQLLIALDTDDPLRQSAQFAERHFPEPMWLPGGICAEPWEPMFLDPTRVLRKPVVQDESPRQ